ncbi:hypothetical protein PRIPAC_75386 [Pristionchus pacificus]|uniref:Uncharacterized protein n=1 Tax=Pristionchus pacificus TaxID=54126 RepID=A0A454Y3J4_PRIPA|nr:hypothetical protein PRIPAC_75386 [Pristionchus pacificus]|eukprot:PDM71532.1 hypothetical protein PRIPAC_37939 [Pristionchus pacificus]
MEHEEKKKSLFSRILARFLALFHHRRPLLPTEPSASKTPIIDGDFRQTPSPHTMSEVKMMTMKEDAEVGQKWAAAVKQEQEETERRRQQKHENFAKAKASYSDLATALPKEMSFSARLPDSDNSSVPDNDTTGTGVNGKTGTALEMKDVSKTGVSRTESSPYINLSNMASAGSYLSETVELHVKTMNEESTKAKKNVATPTTPLQLVRASPEKKGAKCTTTCQAENIPRESPSSVNRTTPKAGTVDAKKTPSPGQFGWRSKITIRRNGVPHVEPTQSELDVNIKKTSEEYVTPKPGTLDEKKSKERNKKQ